MSALDTQVGGSHYKDMAIQPMEFSMANGLDACQHTIIKYVTRFRAKGGIQDLEKAKHVIDMLIEFEKAGTRPPTVEPEQAAEAEAEAADEKKVCGCPACRMKRELRSVLKANNIEVVFIGGETGIAD